MAAQCAILWIGKALGRIERACLRSVVRQGHSVHLYCYATPQGVPEGIDLRDAAEVLPESTIIRHKSGSVALFANRFRYELQRRGLGTWLDCDVYLLSPLDGQAPHLFGLESADWIANSILRLPADSPMLPPLLEIFEERSVPPWLPWRAKAAAYWRLIGTGRSGLSRMPWGMAGPRALTAVARAHGAMRFALDQEVLYPAAWQDAAWIRDPAVTLEDMISTRSVAIHLWNERIKHFKDERAAPGSFLARLHQEGK
jgi:hypothetical protein